MYHPRYWRVPRLVASILEGVAAAMPEKDGELLRAQVRLLNNCYVYDREICMYPLRWWGLSRKRYEMPSFPNQSDEHVLAKVRFRLPDAGKAGHAKVHLVRGNVFTMTLSFVPRGKLRLLAVVEKVELSDSYMALVPPEARMPRSARTVPACLVEFLSTEQRKADLQSFEPASKETLTRTLETAFEKYPADLLRLLQCTDGMLTNTGVLYGHRDLRVIPVADFDFCVIGEFLFNNENGVIGWCKKDPQMQIFWASFDLSTHVPLGQNLAMALKNLLERVDSG